MADVPVQHREKALHRVPHAQSAHKQQHTAEHTQQRHRRTGFMPQYVADVPARAERQPAPERKTFDGAFADGLRRVRTKRVRSRAPEHSFDGQVADQREKGQRGEYDGDAEARHDQFPRGQIQIGAHHPGRADDERGDQAAERDAQR